MENDPALQRQLKLQVLRDHYWRESKEHLRQAPRLLRLAVSFALSHLWLRSTAGLRRNLLCPVGSWLRVLSAYRCSGVKSSRPKLSDGRGAGSAPEPRNAPASGRVSNHLGHTNQTGTSSRAPDETFRSHSWRGQTPNDQAQAQPPETGVACNDDVQISWLGQN